MAEFKIKAVLDTFQFKDFKGDANRVIRRAVGIQDGLKGDFGDAMSWINDRMSSEIDPAQVQLGLIVLSKIAYAKMETAQTNFIIVANPRAAFFEIVAKYFKSSRTPVIESTAQIHSSAVLGIECYVGHHVVIEKNCRIGDHTSILHNTTILEGTTIGSRVTIGCNNTIGNYGFGYEKDSDGNYFGLEHTGSVIIGDQVEIHNNTCIDRGVLGPTEIHENVKIDNLVHIAHGVVIGRNSLVIANAMVAGSVQVGENSWIAPSVSIKNKIKIAADTMTGIGATILKNTESGATYIGNPATTLDEYKKWSDIRKKLLKPE